MLHAQFVAGQPDVVLPDLIAAVPEARALYESDLRRDLEDHRAAVRRGVREEMALYLLPNAFPVRFLESGDLLHLHHKWVHRLCYTAQEEIWRASVEEVAAGARRAPALAKHIAAVHAAQAGRHHPVLPRGPALLRGAGVEDGARAVPAADLVRSVRTPPALDAFLPPPRSAGRDAGAWSTPPDFSGLPPWAPQNPLEANRSVLFAPPLMMPQGDWGLTVAFDYASSVELYSQGQRSVTLDAELARLQVWLTRRITERWFVFGQVQIQGAYDGFMDQFLDWYHSLPRGEVHRARAAHPNNRFDYEVVYGKGQTLRYRPVDLAIGDTRLGVGWMLGAHAQLLFVLGLPTATALGYGAGTLQTGLILTGEAPLLSWLTLSGSVGVGFTPKTGTLVGLPERGLRLALRRPAGPAQLEELPLRRHLRPDPALPRDGPAADGPDRRLHRLRLDLPDRPPDRALG